MAILNFAFQSIGKDGTFPRICTMETNDTLGQITTAGFLNPLVAQGNAVYPNDVFFISYGPASATTSQFTVTVSNGVYTLALGETGVVLPTIANHIATYTNTVGTLSEDPATAISGGNIQAGLSGTAGYLASFPGTASKGSLHVTAVANTGNTVTTISNDAMGQASVINIPDPANAVSQFLVAATATPFTTGHLPQSSGVAGLMVDSGIAAANVILNGSVSGQSVSSVTSSATPGTIRALKGLITETNATMASGNIVGLRGEVDMVGASGGFQYGVQGKVIPTGTLSGSSWTAPVFGQFDISGATINAGQTAPVWADYGATSGTISDATGMRMFAGTNTTAATLFAMDYRYGKATNLLELDGNAGTYITSSGAGLPSGTVQKIAISIDGVTYYLVASTVVS